MGQGFESLQACHVYDSVGIAQLVRVPGCGPGGRRFEADYPPHSRAGGVTAVGVCFPKSKTFSVSAGLTCRLSAVLQLPYEIDNGMSPSR